MQPFSARDSIPKPTITGCTATAYGLHALAKYAHSVGVSKFLTGKARSDPTEVRKPCKLSSFWSDGVYFQQVMGALRFGSYKITAAKVSQRLSNLQTLQVLTESANVASNQAVKKRCIDFSNQPLAKRPRSRRSLVEKSFYYKRELQFLEACGEAVYHFGFVNLLPELQKFDAKIWCDGKILEAVVSPWNEMSRFALCV